MSRRAAAVLAVTTAACVTAAPAFADSHHGRPSARAAVQLYTESVKPLGNVGGVTIDGAGYGSSFALKPGSRDVFYGLTDRGRTSTAPTA